METTMMRGKVPELDAHLGYWLRRVSNRVSGEFARSLQEQQASVAEWVFVRQLYAREEASPAEMASAMGLTRSAISKVMDKLEAKGWLASRVKPDDQRAQILSLTRRGMRAVPELAEIAGRNDDAFFGYLSKAERDALLRLLRKLSDAHNLETIPVE